MSIENQLEKQQLGEEKTNRFSETKGLDIYFNVSFDQKIFWFRLN